MIPFFSRRAPITPAFVTAPAEPSPDGDEQRIARINADAYAAYREGDIHRADRLLDLRNAIRPACPAEVPVIPGRPT